MSEAGEAVLPKAEFHSADEWLELFQDETRTHGILAPIYGDNADVISQRTPRYVAALTEASKTFGADRQVALVRSPSRINLRGMHSEMQHASPNYLSHGREVIMVVEKRQDDQVVIHNTNADRFPPRHFRISEEMARGPWGTWTDYIDGDGVRRSLEAARGDWSNYVKASVLVLQDHVGENPMSGMNVMVCGDIPLVGGMSSSSAMVVASGLACVAVNDMQLGREELVILLGRGEWYVGTRGGFGDHGAMLLARYGGIVHTPFVSVEGLKPEYIDFPDDHQIIIVNSYKMATKSSDQLFNYNQTIFCYSIALTLIKDVMEQTGVPQDVINGIQYLGQITPEAFGSGKIYRMLRALPERVNVDELKAKHPKMVEEGLARFFGQLGRYPDYLTVRGPGLWGMAESERSRAFARLVRDGNMAEACELMYIGQDGDRLYTFDDDGTPRPYTDNLVTDAYLDELLDDLASDDPDRQKRAQLARQPGHYNCSSLELDTIVEILRRTPGVVGASLTGAGFGGIVLGVARKEEGVFETVCDTLTRDYYEAQERQELDWVAHSTELKELLGASEAQALAEKLAALVTRKQAARGPMTVEDLDTAGAATELVNGLFAQGKTSRFIQFIKADYYAEGIAQHIPVDGAGPVRTDTH